MSGPRSKRVVSKGRIRVDAAKAMAKLREHLLVDLHDYALEVVRAAVASDAERIDVGFDADDMMITWVGRPIPARTIEHLLDHVLTEAKGAEAERLRLLALGVNAALGLEPAYVEIYSVSPAGKKCTRVRWKPEMLKGEGEAPRPEPEVVPVPPGMAGGAIRVQLRRRVGWAVLRRAALGGAPAEVLALTRATGELHVPMTLGGQPWPRAERPPAVARFPLALSDEVDRGVRYAALEVFDPGTTPRATRPSIEVLEHGVRLASYAFEPKGFVVEPYEGVGVPMRIVVDALSLPTNASRSAVREDSALFSDVMAAAEVAFTTALETMLDAFRKPQNLPESVWLADDHAPLERVLGAFSCVAIGGRRADKSIGKLGGRLVYLPLFFDACGDRRSWYGLEPSPGQSLIVYEGDEPLDDELSRWLNDVMWARGSLVERVMRGVVKVPADELVEAAREKLALWQAFHDREQTDVAVPPAPNHLVHESFEVDEGPFRGLVGQVAVKSTKRKREGGTLRIFSSRRELAIRSIATRDCPLPLDIAIQWKRIRVKDTYDGIEETPELREAIWYAIRVGVLAACGVADALEDEGSSAKMKARVRVALRQAFGVATMGPSVLGGREGDTIPIAEDSALMTARVWPTIRPGRYVSLLDVRGVIAERGVFCMADAGAKGSALDERVVLAPEGRDREWLVAHFGLVAAVSYDRALVTQAKAGRMLDARWQNLERSVARALTQQSIFDPPHMRFELDGLLGIIAPASESRIVLAHAGHSLTEVPHAAAFGPVVIAVDDPRVSPNATWNGVSSGTGTAWTADDVERDLLATCIAAINGDRRSQRKLSLRGAAASALEWFLLASAKAIDGQLNALGEKPARPGARGSQLAALYEQLAAISLLTVLDEDGRPRPTTIGELDVLHPSPAPVPMLSRAPGFATHDWFPLIAKGDMGMALRRFLGPRLVAGEGEIAKRREIAEREANRRRLLSKKEVDIWELGGLARRGAHVERYASDAITVAVSLPPTSLEYDRAIVDLVLERRALGRGSLEALPVVARVGLTDASWFDATLSQLNRTGISKVIGHVKRAACQLALTLAETKLDDGAAPTMMDPALARLCAAILKDSGLEEQKRALKRAIRYKARWPKVQGGHTALGLCVGRTAKGEVEFGTDVYGEWTAGKRKSRFDNPIVHLPESELGRDLRAILKSYSFQLRNVTMALSKLQARRTGAAGKTAPTLDGTPAHPSLRASAEELRLGGIEGEIELIEGEGKSWIMVTDLEGAAPFDLELGCSLRAAVMVDLPRGKATHTEVVGKLTRAVSLIFANVHTKLDELPRWVRDAYRGHLVYKLSANTQLYKRDERAPVFVDTAGELLSLQELGQQKVNWYTNLAPPYPAHPFQRSILALTDRERAALKRRKIKFVEQNDLVLRARNAEKRRHAEPVRRMQIPGGVARQCLARRRVDDGDLRGEVGILQPDAELRMGVFLHTSMRPLCRLDVDGWPAVAMLDHDELEPNTYFDGMAKPKQGVAIMKRVKQIVAELVDEHTRAPKDALAVHDLVLKKDDSVIVGGRFWFPASFPNTPTVRVDAIGGSGRTQNVPLYRVPVPPGQVSPTIPVEGHVMVISTPGVNIQGVLAKRAMAAASKMLAGLAKESSPLLERYRWNVAILGGKVGARLAATTTDGSVDEKAIVSEIGKGHMLWWTAHRGSSFGKFPGEPPPFILRDEPGSAVMQVLRARAPTRLSELGGFEPDPAPPRPAPKPKPKAKRKPEPAPQPSVEVDEPRAHVEDSWLAGLKRRVLSVFVDLPPPAPASVGFAAAVNETLDGLELPVGSVAGVAFTRSGRPVRFRLRDHRVLINRDHPDVLALVGADVVEPSHEALTALAAAALSELNRAHEKVTGAEEKHALQLLAEQLG